jgi:regulator of protease activity HflC (stomatin/prohibitin superfamily)
MNQQLTAERTKRAAILEAEGRRQSKILDAQGDRDSQIARAEGDKQSQVLRADGEAQAIKIVALAAKNNLVGPAAMFWQLKTFSEVGQAPSTKFVIPMELIQLGKDISDKLGKK